MYRNLQRFVASHLVRVASAVVLLASYPLLFAAALLPTGTAGRLPGCWLFVTVAIVSYLAEVWARCVVPDLMNTLNWLQVGTQLRWAFRELALIILLARVLSPSSELVAFASGLMVLHAVRAIYSALAIRVAKCRTLPAVTRNVDLAALGIPNAPPPWLVQNDVQKLLYLDTIPVAGGLAAALTADFTWGFAGISLALAVSAILCVIMAVFARRNRHLNGAARVLSAVRQQVAAYRPEVVLFLSGSRDAIYQVNVWLSTLAQLQRPTMIILRQRYLVPLLGRTSLPVVCVDETVDLMNFDLPSVRVALFPANSAQNIVQLRIPRVGRVFIGHGDSDKAASVNPFSRAYDQVWVAGKAGRDRYLRAQVGVRGEDIVEVGRPQLTGIRTAEEGAADRMFTVLYAPTWEGWTDSETSFKVMGLRIVQALVDHAPQVRVLYKPHPLTGTHDKSAAAVHEAIVALIDRANDNLRRTGSWPAEAAGEADRPGAAAELSRIGARMAELAQGGDASPGSWFSWMRPGKDEATLSRDSRPPGADDSEWARLNDAWHATYWRSQGWWQHRVITGPMPILYECFNRADMLISDISSVVSDFIASGKPYVVTNPDGLNEDKFRERFPTAAAAYLLDRDCAALSDILAQAAAPGDDGLAEARRELRRYLLGPDNLDAQTRFAEAVDALAERVARSPDPDSILVTAPLAQAVSATPWVPLGFDHLDNVRPHQPASSPST
jgi:hypothetical protein